MASYKLISVKGAREIEGTEQQAIEAARAMYAELQPAYGITVENEAGESVAEIDETPAADIAVLGIGSEFDLPDDAEQDTDMEWYGTVRVRVNGVEYQVGAVLGVPESDRGSARASGSIQEFLNAWYADSSDWDSAPASNGTTGVPRGLASAVIAEIRGSVRKLWREVR